VWDVKPSVNQSSCRRVWGDDREIISFLSPNQQHQSTERSSSGRKSLTGRHPCLIQQQLVTEWMPHPFILPLQCQQHPAINTVKAKFHYAIQLVSWSQTGSRFELSRHVKIARTWSQIGLQLVCDQLASWIA